MEASTIKEGKKPKAGSKERVTREKRRVEKCGGKKEEMQEEELKEREDIMKTWDKMGVEEVRGMVGGRQKMSEKKKEGERSGK